MQEFHNIDIKYTNHHDKRIQVTSHSGSARVRVHHRPPSFTTAAISFS